MDEDNNNQNQNQVSDDIEMIEDKEGNAPEIAERTGKLRGELKKCDQEKKEYLDGWQRAKADFINYKKDEAKRFEDILQFVSRGMIEDILPTLDSFDLALRHGFPAEAEKGILLIRTQLTDALKKRGLAEIEVKAGDEFNPETHESVGEVESSYPAGSIAEEVQKGYMLAERVIRPTRVRLGKGE
ncbi:MAG: molecular chaperone GrpE [Parcubacteria group bacterium Gr01-1014_33]|nr:MAG: molecular chaperone GrpE [Parcubacteria group bacterium Gr01-1014_33]